MHKRMIAMVAAALAAATVFADYTYYVRQNGGNDSNNGTSYETAFATYGRVNGENPDIGCYEYWWYLTGILLFVQ